MQIPDKCVNYDSNLISDFEESFKNCLSLLLINNETLQHENQDDKKTGIEFAIESFVEKAKDVESFFITQRLLNSSSNPDDLLLEEINDIRSQLALKEELIKRHREKLSHWQTVLADFSSGPSSTTYSSPMPNAPNYPQQHNQAQTLGINSGSNFMSKQQYGGPLLPAGTLNSSSNTNSRSICGNSTLSGLLSRTPTGLTPLANLPYNPQLQQAQLDIPAPAAASKLEGPLAFLEKTASNIGHN